MTAEDLQKFLRHDPVPCANQSTPIRLDTYLSSLPEIHAFANTRSHIKNLIEIGAVLVNGKNIKPSYAVKINNEIQIQIPQVKTSELIPYPLPLDIIFEDDNLIVVNKPSGLVIHPAAGHEQDTLVNALLHHTPHLSMKNEQRPGIVHRIDKDTSGLLVIAKNDQTHELLSAQFKEKTTHRIYYAIVQGHLKQNKGTLQSYLTRHGTDRKRYASVKINGQAISTEIKGFEKGKWSKTHYEVLEVSQHMSLVRLQLETGRTHQIRVHMSELGHPLVGDTMYGYSIKKYNELQLNRFYLHAAELGFRAINNQLLIFKVNWPTVDLNQIRQWGFQWSFTP